MNDTAKPEPEKTVLAKVETSVCGLVLNNLEDMTTVAQIILQSGIAPDSFKTKEQIFVGLQTGAEIGLKPMQSLNSIVVINGKPTLWGDAALALVKRSGLLLSFSEKVTGEGDDMIAVVASVRVDGEGEKALKCIVETPFTVADAKTAGLWKKKGPWTTHPKRMLKYKARAFNLRDNFPDVLFGMHLTEEMIGEEPLPAPESDVPPRDQRRMAVPSSTVDTTRAPADANTKTSKLWQNVGPGGPRGGPRASVVTGVKTEPVIEGQEPSRAPLQEVRETLVQELEKVTDAVLGTEKAPAAEKKPCEFCKDSGIQLQDGEVDIFCECPIGEKKYAAFLKDNPDSRPQVTFQCPLCLRTYQYGKEEGKGVKCKCGKAVIVEQGTQAPEPAGEEEKKTDDVYSLYVEVNEMYIAKKGQDFTEFAAFVLCIDDTEVSPNKLTEEQLIQIKAYIDTSGVAIN